MHSGREVHFTTHKLSQQNNDSAIYSSAVKFAPANTKTKGSLTAVKIPQANCAKETYSTRDLSANYEGEVQSTTSNMTPIISVREMYLPAVNLSQENFDLKSINLEARQNEVIHKRYTVIIMLV